MGKISYSQFAKLVNVSQPAITQAVKIGRLRSYKEEGKLPFLIEEEAMADWVNNTQRGQYGDALKNVDKDPLEIPDGDTPNLTHSRAVRESFKAKIEKLKYEEMTGRLVDIEQVRAEYFELARKVRDSLMAIPDRISAQLAVETDQFKIHKKIQHELRIVLRNLKEENG